MNGISSLLFRSAFSPGSASLVFARSSACPRQVFITRINLYASKSNPVNHQIAVNSLKGASAVAAPAKCSALLKLDPCLLNSKLRRLFNLNKCHKRFLETTSQTRNYLIKYLNWSALKSVNSKRIDLGRRIAPIQRLMANSSVSFRQRGIWNASIFRQNFSTSNKTSNVNTPTPKPSPPPSSSAPKPVNSAEHTLAGESTKAQTLNIFQRFKAAYKQHGKILIYCHIITCCGWMAGFFVLAENGLELSKFLGLFEKACIISHETSESIVNKIKTFDLKQFLINYHFDYVLPERAINWLGESITGSTLNSCLTAIMLYKIVTPFRYMLTLGVARVVITLFKRRGLMPAHPPPGSSIQDLYKEQKLVLRRGLKQQRERYSTTRVGRLINKHTKPPKTSL